jgi:hypothetical protein
MLTNCDNFLTASYSSAINDTLSLLSSTEESALDLFKRIKEASAEAGKPLIDIAVQRTIADTEVKMGSNIKFVLGIRGLSVFIGMKV